MIIAVFLHISYFALGVLLLHRFAGYRHLFNLRSVHWVAAYFIGLLANGVTAFVVNQGHHLQALWAENPPPHTGVTLSAPMLAGIAVGLIVAAFAFPRKKTAPIEPLDQSDGADPNPQSSSQGWTALHWCLAAVVVYIFAKRHGAILWAPLDDWDSFLYHLPFGQLIGQSGHFPDDIGPSINQKSEAAYPPLFFFLYGINFRIHEFNATYLLPKLTYITLEILVCLTCYRLARDRFGLRRTFALFAILCLTLNAFTQINMHILATIYVLLGLYYSWPWIDGSKSDWRRGLVAASFWAGCYWSNYLGAPLSILFFTGMGLGLCIQTYKNKRDVINDSGQATASTARPFIKITITAVAFLLIISPHLIRNLLVAGNPLYPALLDTLGGIGVTDWFLENRFLVKPITVTWQSVPQIFGRLPIVIVAAAICLCYLRSIPISQRVMVGTFLIGFLIVWLAVLQISEGLAPRYLITCIPLASILISRLFQQSYDQCRIGDALGLSHLFFLSPWILFGYWIEPDQHITILAVWFYSMLLVFMIGGPIAVARLKVMQRPILQAPPNSESPQYSQTPVMIYLGLCALVLLAPAVYRYHDVMIGWTLIIVVLFPLLVWWLLAKGGRQSSSINRPYSARLPAIIILLALTAGTEGFNYRNATAYYLPFNSHVVWMNYWLPKDAVVLVLENRLFTFEREIFPADDPRMQDFYEAKTLDQHLDSLRQLGITHIYLNAVWGSPEPYRSKINYLHWKAKTDPRLEIRKDWRPPKPGYGRQYGGVIEVIANPKPQP